MNWRPNDKHRLFWLKPRKCLKRNLAVIIDRGIVVVKEIIDNSGWRTTIEITRHRDSSSLKWSFLTCFGGTRFTFDALSKCRISVSLRRKRLLWEYRFNRSKSYANKLYLFLIFLTHEEQLSDIFVIENSLFGAVTRMKCDTFWFPRIIG